MTGAELITISLLYIVYTFVILIIGIFFGAVFTMAHVQKQISKAHDEMARQLLAPPQPPIIGGPAEEYKKQEAEDDKWLRDQLDGNDNKEKDK